MTLPLTLQIRVRITSELLLNESETGGEYYIRIATRIEQSTQLELFGVKRIKQEHIDSRHFVAYRYDNRLLRIRALELATKQPPSPAFWKITAMPSVLLLMQWMVSIFSP